MSGITSTQAVVEMPDQPVDMMGMQDKVDSLVEIMTEVENARATIRSQSACLWRGEHNKPRSPGWPDPVFDPKVRLCNPPSPLPLPFPHSPRFLLYRGKQYI